MNRLFVIAALLSACWRPAPPAPVAPTKQFVPASRMPDGPYATRVLRGPYRSRADWCSDLAKRMRASQELDASVAVGCATHAVIVSRGPTRATASSGILAAEILAVDEGDSLWGPKCALVLRTAAGVFAYEDLDVRCLADPKQPSIVQSVEVGELAFRDVVTRASEGLGDELVLRATVVRRTPSSGNVTATDMFVCGIGASGIPRCTPAIPVHHVGVVSDVDYHPTIDPAGVLRFAVEDRGETMMEDDAETARFAERHPLRFP